MASKFLSRLAPLPTPEQMRQWDALAIEFGIPETMLMENASLAILEQLRQLDFLSPDQNIWLFMGNGNNGGDAAALARHLLSRGMFPLVFHLSPLASLKNACAWHAALAQKAGVPFKILEPVAGDNPFFKLLQQLPTPLNPPCLIVDGLLGTGFHGQLREDMRALVNAINELAAFHHCPIAAIDTPSGLDSRTGDASPVALKAAVTITLAAAKPGLVLPKAQKWVGELYCRPIGMPKNQDYPVEAFLLDASALCPSSALPENSYKNLYGHVFVLGGSPGLEGAAQLTCLASLRQGCGLVTACAPQAALPKIKGSHPEIMTMPLAAGAEWPAKIPDNLLYSLENASSVALGPGLGRSAGAKTFLQAFLALDKRPPAVFDADSLQLLAIEPRLLDKLRADDVITPHPGEAAALLRCPASAIQQDRYGALEKLKALAPCAIVLKGAATLVGSRDFPTLLCPWDIPQLAIGGSGDVLSGCCAALLARKTLSSLEAAALAVATHAIAGMILARNYPERGAIATDLVEALPKTGEFINNLQKNRISEERLPWPPFPLPT